MGIDLSNEHTIHQELMDHLGHKISCVSYRKHGHLDFPIVGTAIECETCGTVLISGEPPAANDHLVPAKIWSDDHILEGDFDASFFFKVATDAEIRRLIEDEFSRGYGADNVADHCRHLFIEIQQVFDYVALMHEKNAECIGFEVEVDDRAAYQYLWESRPSLMRELQAEGVDVGTSAAAKFYGGPS